MKRTFLLFAFTFFAISMFGQSEVRFKASVSKDSVLLGNGIEVLFTLEGAKGTNFIPPAFEQFTVISGPNVRTVIQMTNGKTKQSTVYSYYVQPNDIGLFYIEPASIEIDGILFSTSPVAVIVHPNPDGIIEQRIGKRQDFKMEFGFPPFEHNFEIPFREEIWEGFQNLDESLNKFEQEFEVLRKKMFENFNFNFSFPEMPSDSTLREKKERDRVIQKI